MLKENDENLNGMILLIQEYSCLRKGFFSHESAKNELRTSLKLSTLDSIMRISVDGPHLSKFNAKKAVDNWMQNALGNAILSQGTNFMEARKRSSS